MKTYSIVIVTVALLSVLGFSRAAVRCNNGSYCQNGQKCCKSGSGYTCCPSSKTCSRDGKYCDSRFSANSEEEDTCDATEAVVLEITPADIFVLVDSFFDYLKVYDFVPQTTACGKNLSVLAPDVTALIEKIIKIKSPEELIPIAITIYTELYPRVVEILKGCDGVSEELKEKLAVILAYVQAKEFFPKSFKQLKLDSQKSLFKSVLL